MTRWKYKDVDGHLNKRKFNAYKNSGIQIGLHTINKNNNK